MDTTSTLVEEALVIARERAEILAAMRDALLAKDEQRALHCAKQLCGVKDDD